MIAEEFEGVAALDEALPCVDQALELDRLDLGAVLLGLGAALRLLVAVECGLDAVDLRWKRLTNDQRRSARSSSRRVPVSIASRPRPRLRSGGRRFRARAAVGVRLVLARAIAVERQLVEQMRGRRRGMARRPVIGVEEGEGAVVARHGGCLSAGGSAAPVAAFTAIQEAGDGTGSHTQGRSAAEDGGRRAFCFALQSRPAIGAAAENGRRPPLRARFRLRQIAAREGRGAASFRRRHPPARPAAAAPLPARGRAAFTPNHVRILGDRRNGRGRPGRAEERGARAAPRRRGGRDRR